MSLAELIETAEFVVDAQGNKKAVLLDFLVWEELLQQLAGLEYDEAVQGDEVTTMEAQEDVWAFELCGIWDDPRPAEEVVEEIISARTVGREVVL